MDGSYEEPVLVRNALEETFLDEDKSEVESKLGLQTETQFSSSQHGMKSRLLTDDEKNTPQHSARMKGSRSKFVQKSGAKQAPYISELDDISNELLRNE